MYHFSPIFYKNMGKITKICRCKMQRRCCFQGNIMLDAKVKKIFSSLYSVTRWYYEDCFKRKVLCACLAKYGLKSGFVCLQCAVRIVKRPLHWGLVLMNSESGKSALVVVVKYIKGDDVIFISATNPHFPMFICVNVPEILICQNCLINLCNIIIIYEIFA